MPNRRIRSDLQCEACQSGRAQAGLRICRRCEQQTRSRLGRQAELCRELTITLARQDRLDPRPEAGRSANRPLPYKEPAAAALRDQRQLLWRWVDRVICDQDQAPAATISGYADWLRARLTEIRKRDDVPELVVSLESLTGKALRAIDHPLMKAVQVGPCPGADEDGRPCGGQVSVFIPLDGSDRASWMQCDKCRQEIPSREWHRLAARISARRTGIVALQSAGNA